MLQKMKIFYSASVGASVRPNMLNMPKSVSVLTTVRNINLSHNVRYFGVFHICLSQKYACHQVGYIPDVLLCR